MNLKNKTKQWSSFTSDSWGREWGINALFLCQKKKKEAGIYCCGMCGWKMKKMVKSFIDVE